MRWMARYRSAKSMRVVLNSTSLPCLGRRTQSAPRSAERAAAHDVILFVSGAKSSNGRVLFGHCLQVNPDTHLISNASEVDPAWLEGKDSIGICGATSTPRWLMDQIGNLIIESLKK